MTAGPAFDRYLDHLTPTTQAFVLGHYDRMTVFSPAFDAHTAWYPRGNVYQDAYAIHSAAEVAAQPELVLRDGRGRPLFIPYECNGLRCPQYAADIGSQAWRERFVERARRLLAKGYSGLFVDDVNLDMEVSDGSGRPVAPIDPRTGAPMAEGAWRGYFAQFMEQLRAALPGAEIVHNAVWTAGGPARDAGADVQRQLAAADYVNLERGVLDAGLTGGDESDPWSLRSLLAFVDRVHAHGRHVVHAAFARNHAQDEYALAGFLLANDGQDRFSTALDATPDSWWSLLDTDLGDALGPRREWEGVLRRDFTGGVVLLDPPEAGVRVLRLDGTYRDSTGRPVTRVALWPRHAAVLTR